MGHDLIRTWSCEIGVVPENMLEDGADAPFRNAVEKCWEDMFPGIPCGISSGWGTPGALPPGWELSEFKQLPAPEANLGCATTEELFRELIARCTANNIVLFNRALVLAEMLGGLDAQEREYRTIDS